MRYGPEMYMNTRCNEASEEPDLCCGYMISHASVTIPEASKPCVRSLLSRYTSGDPGHTRAVRTVTATGHKIPNLLGENIFRGPHILPSPRRFIGEHGSWLIQH